MRFKHSQIYLTLLLLLITRLQVFSSDKPAWAYSGFAELNSSRFIENKGQLTDVEGNPRSDIKFYLSSGNSTVFFQPNSLLFSFTENLNINESNAAQTDLKLNTIILEFPGSRANPEIILEEPTGEHLNFYYDHCPNGITHVKSYRKATYRDIYRNIDLVVYATGDRFGFKYDFIVRKGGSPDDIHLKYNNASKITAQSDGSVRIQCETFEINEKQPLSYQNKSGRNKKVESSILLNDNTIKFQVGDYDKNKQLVIDPVINWATFYGGSDGDHSASISLDFQTNVIIAGNTLSKNFPVTNGTTYKGAFDLFVAKFDYSGKRLWATYYGGKLADYMGGVAIDSAAHIYATGWTWDLNFPVSPGCFQPVNRGGQNEGILLKLLRDGTRDWATFVGGSNDEHLYSVAVNKSFEVVVAGWSKSSNFPNDSTPVTAKSFGEDIALACFKNDGSYIWSTFHGGDSADAAYGVVYDLFGNIAVVGYTHSTNFKLSSDAQQSFYGGEKDVCISRFDSRGKLFYSSYFGGSKSDWGTALTIDSKSNLIITGYTFSSDMPVTTLAYQKKNNGLVNALISKFTFANQLVWSSYLGGSSEDYSFSVATDRNDNILITGQTLSNDFPATINAFQRTLKGASDAFAAKFTPDGVSSYWITYYGGDDEDMGNDLIVDFYHNIYVSGDTKSTDFPITSNAHQKSLAGQHDCFIFKHCATSPYTEIKINGKSTVCQGETVTLDAGPGFLFYEWSTGETTQTIKAGVNGPYSVKVTDTMYCDFTSAPVLINVLPLPDFNIEGNAKFCEGDSAVLSVPSEYTIYKWSTGQTSRTIVLHSNQRVILTVTDINGCTGYDTADVVKSPMPKPLIHGPKVVCAFSSNVTYYVYGVAGHSYQWIVNGGEIKTGGDYFNVQIDWKAIGKARIYIYQTDNTSGCTGIDSLDVTISDHLEPTITTPTGKYLFCSIDTVELDAGLGYLNYRWNTNESSQKIKITKPGKYWVRVTGEANCTGYDTVDIQLHPPPSPVISGDSSICESTDFFDYSSPFFDGHVYNWSIANGNIISGQGTNKISVLWIGSGSGILSLQETDTTTTCVISTPDYNVIINPLPSARIAASGNTQFCLGDSVLLTAMGINDFYQWNTGDTTKSIVAKSEGTYLVKVISRFGCSSYDSIFVRVFPKPTKPEITAIDDTLISSSGMNYQWYRNDTLLASENNKNLITQIDGKYKVVHGNQFGCTEESEEYDYIFVPKIAYTYFSMPDTIFVNTGEGLSIPLTLDSSRKMVKVGAKDFDAYLSFNGSVLAIDDRNIPYTKSGGRKIIRIAGSNTDTIGLYLTIPFHAALGDSVCTNVTVDTIMWKNANVVSYYRNCVVCLKDLCYEGGVRLYHSRQFAELKQNKPNPAADKTSITFVASEKGRHILYLSDIYGSSKIILFDREIEKGTYEVQVNLKNYNTGTYLYMLDSPSQRLTGKMQVIK